MTPAAEAQLSKPRKPGKPGRKRAAQAPPPQGDYGPDTNPDSAQMRNAEIVPLYAKGGDWNFKRRLHPLDILAKPYGRRRVAAISASERNAGMDVVRLAEATQRGSGPAWNKVYVDASPKPGDIDVKRLDAETKLKRMRSVVPREALPIVNHVVFNEGLIRPEFTDDAKRERYWLDQLRTTLRLWADILGY